MQVVDQNTTQEVCKTKYVYIEMILNKDTKYDVVAGLFKGIIEKDDDKFILLHGLKESTNVLNLKFYNIMMIEELEDDYKNMMYLNLEESDQKTAMEEVEKLYAKLLAAGKGLENDPRILDITKFKDVPKEYIEGKPIEKSTGTNVTTTTNNGVGSFANPATRYVSGAGTYTRTAVKADPEPAVLGRSQTGLKKPLKASLDLMEEKINQIMAGTFVPVLPETMGEDAEGTGDAVETEDELYYRTGIGFC
jgi:hypothetical protein